MHSGREAASRIERPSSQGVDGLPETGRGSKSADISSKGPVEPLCPSGRKVARPVNTSAFVGTHPVDRTQHQDRPWLKNSILLC